MRIQSLTIHNFKSFEGTCHINGLTDNLDSRKPIILFGGLNGAGKTTIFEAILLCLYGNANKTLFPSRGAKKEDYLSYIVAVTNEAAKVKSVRAEMWIEVAFDQVVLGDVAQSLTLKRKWLVDSFDNTAKEVAFEITQNGKPIGFVAQDSYDDFISHELIPYEVTQFFFFDGEKIQDFIKDEDKTFAESLEKVLGIGLYRILKDDVSHVRANLLREYNKDKEAQSQLVSLDAEDSKAEIRLKECEQETIQLQDEIDEIQARIAEIDRDTLRITRTSAESREESEGEKTKLIAEKSMLEEYVFGAMKDSLPFLMMWGLCQDLIAQLDDEQEVMRGEALRQAGESRVSSIITRLFEEDPPRFPLNGIQKEFYRGRLREILLETFGTHTTSPVPILHSLSLRDSALIKSRFQEAEGVQSKLTTHLRRLQEIEPRLRQMQRAEQRSVNDDTRTLYEERGQLQEKINTKGRAIDRLTAEILRLNDEGTSRKRRRTDLEDKVSRTLHVHRQIEYCQKIKGVLDEFSHRLRVRKVEKLQEYTLEMWSKLARKQDQISSITIDPDRNFSVDLFDGAGRPIDKTKLSAGEKELLAIALIWGLTRLTNRSLPIVIDTPLGRLDSEHRAHIAERYFPNAGHQVILLSTDTEVIGPEYEAIAPFVCKHYLIEKDTAQESSRIIEGYFKTDEY